MTSSLLDNLLVTIVISINFDADDNVLINIYWVTICLRC